MTSCTTKRGAQSSPARKSFATRRNISPKRRSSALPRGRARKQLGCRQRGLTPCRNGEEADIGIAAPSLARTVVFGRLNEGWRHVRRRVPSKLRHRRRGPMPRVPRQKRKKLRPKLLRPKLRSTDNPRSRRANATARSPSSCCRRSTPRRTPTRRWPPSRRRFPRATSRRRKPPTCSSWLTASRARSKRRCSRSAWRAWSGQSGGSDLAHAPLQNDGEMASRNYAMERMQAELIGRPRTLH